MVRPQSLAIGLATLLAALGLGAYWLTSDSGSADLQTSVSVADAMESDTVGYRRATTVPDFSFPADHGPHPDYKNEWWYLTGNLSGPDGRPFGYELTIFRFALAPPSDTTAPRSASDWRTDQFYMGHFAVTDSTGQAFYADERFGRGGAGLAGAQADPFRVWLEDWAMESTGESSGEDPFPMRLRAQQEGAAIDLTVRPEKPRVLQGDRGLSQKGPGSGNASYYYAYTRLATEGTIVSGTDTTEVTGQSWMDREWSTSALGPDQEGWDWFALQLDDGRDLMYYQLRNTDGSPSSFSEGTIVGPDGSTTTIGRDDVTLKVLDTWTTPDGTRTYPVEWRLEIPSADVDVRISSLMENQEMDVSVRYWEGAVRVRGSDTGRGYVELTGYGDSAASPAS
ncbi:MAG: lipocalin-like domain-containing protein [Salinivenus sp.]